MLMPGRTLNSSSYRYGAANGQEKSTEINENSYTADYWQYDARIVRRWNPDPVFKEYESPYAAFANNPIWIMDPNGADSTKPVSGVTPQDKFTGPGVQSVTGSMRYKNYELRGVQATDGSSYWLARYHYTSGKYKGMYNDEYVVGVDAVSTFLKKADWYHSVSGWSTYDGPELSVKGIGQNWVNTVKNPVNWIGGASIWASSIRTFGGRSVMQGEYTEAAFGGNNLGRTFPTFDKFEAGTATSMKSIDLSLPTYTNNPSAISSTLNGYVNKAASFTTGRRNGFTLDASMIQNREVALGVFGFSNAAQRTALQASMGHAGSQGVQFTLKYFSAPASPGKLFLGSGLPNPLTRILTQKQ